MSFGTGNVRVAGIARLQVSERRAHPATIPNLHWYPHNSIHPVPGKVVLTVPVRLRRSQFVVRGKPSSGHPPWISAFPSSSKQG